MNIDIELMNEFSEWLANNKFQLNYFSGLWQKPSDKQRTFNEVFQMFLESRKA
jgi:N12 class adenine-specific DNA methylase